MNANTILRVGLTAVLGVVEAVASPGTGLFQLVGLPEGATREARVRVRAALSQLGVSIDVSDITISCSGGGFGTYDLAAAVAVLAALGRAPAAALESTAFLGELSLTGALRPVRGILPAVRGAAALGIRRVVVPNACAAEAALVRGIEVLVAGHLSEVVAWANGGALLPTASWHASTPWSPRGEAPQQESAPDLADIRGNHSARRALEIAAAGGHGLLLVGAPGSGKTMLARRMTTILPSMMDEEALDATTLHSVAGMLQAGQGRLRGRPFRAPHHTCSVVGLAGGGDPPRPGEVSLAHSGVLFLDEVDQFKRSAIEALTYALRNGKASIVRSKFRAEFPARPLVVCAAGPCPCGFSGDGQARCACSAERVKRHRERVLEALPFGVSMAARVGVGTAQLVKGQPGEASVEVLDRVVAARAVQAARVAPDGATFDEKAREILYQAAERLRLAPARANDVIRVSRTIADLDGSEAVRAHHVAEALCSTPERVLS